MLRGHLYMPNRRPTYLVRRADISWYTRSANVLSANRPSRLIGSLPHSKLSVRKMRTSYRSVLFLRESIFFWYVNIAIDSIECCRHLGVQPEHNATDHSIMEFHPQRIVGLLVGLMSSQNVVVCGFCQGYPHALFQHVSEE